MQLTLWPEAEKNIWENLDPETQKKVVILLSKLIEKAAPQKNGARIMRPEKDDTKHD